ncbi:hypothetical protein [uncultured Victivallis sp.]|uniref:hypothetical protein n=1 Tax=uncultured Victivallis sp. TaxID=354118 RepID=UPI0025EF4A88|nr:hypothetical protein [uncultured Victivallis sp.]
MKRKAVLVFLLFGLLLVGCAVYFLLRSTVDMRTGEAGDFDFLPPAICEQLGLGDLKIDGTLFYQQFTNSHRGWQTTGIYGRLAPEALALFDGDPASRGLPFRGEDEFTGWKASEVLTIAPTGDAPLPERVVEMFHLYRTASDARSYRTSLEEDFQTFRFEKGPVFGILHILRPGGLFFLSIQRMKL